MKAREPLLLLTAAGICLIISGIHPYDRLTWLLEVAPLFIGAPILVATYRPFPLTPLAYRLIFIHALILILGGHYTYARVPIGAWAENLFHLGRNHYDRLGHFAQGFVPAVIVREILLRRTSLRPGAWLLLLVVSVCVAISAFYELIEWWAAVGLGASAEDFLGTQGDAWDTQWDMFLALVGAIVAQISLSNYHDRELKSVSAAGVKAEN